MITYYYVSNRHLLNIYYIRAKLGTQIDKGKSTENAILIMEMITDASKKLNMNDFLFPVFFIIKKIKIYYSGSKSGKIVFVQVSSSLDVRNSVLRLGSVTSYPSKSVDNVVSV